MNDIEIVKAAFQMEKPEVSRSLIADDFQATSAADEPPMDKESWMGMGDLMRASFPDIDYVIEDIREEGGKVSVTGYFTGTFTNDFDLSAMGMGVYPATGKKIKWPSETSQVTVEGGQITQSHAISSEGMAAFLKPLGGG
ncbi:MAG: ester cyclase [Chloroflexota bacterium]|nr:MAG: ester cyclase [Chloroflexota bacterium]